MLRTRLGLVLLAAALLGAAAPALGAEIRLRLGHVIAAGTPIDVAARRLAELVAARTGGTVAIEVYPDAQLGAERALIEAVQLGSLDMSFTTTGAIGGFAPEFQVLDLPFLFASDAAADAFLDGEPGRRLLATLDRRGIHGVVFLENGWRNFTSSKGPLRRPEDLAGQRIRVMESPLYMGLVSMLRARPMPMAYSELPAALDSGLIDGQENPAVNVYSARMYESQAYMIRDRHTYNVFIFKVNRKRWERLPAELRAVIEGAAREVRDFQRRLNRESDDEFVRRLQAKGVQVHEPDVEDLAAWRFATFGMYDKARQVVGDAWVDLALAFRRDWEAGRYRDGAARPAPGREVQAPPQSGSGSPRPGVPP